ncbi:hypothetical protein PWT90_08456 [Aphanocladium album]|nr:hypothetical protein PWT90_08456 [Aphanocladium album]
MGTRHLIIVIYKGRWHIAQYGQYDGYAEGAGMNLVRLLSSADLVDKMRAGIVHTYEVSSDDEIRTLWDDAEAARARLDNQDTGCDADGKLLYSPFHRFCQDPAACYSDELLEMRPSLHRNVGSGILVLVAHATAERRLPVQLDLEFANDGLFCEWAYVVDLDADVLEVYQGATAKTPDHRFADVGDDNDTVPGYITSVAFGELGRYRNDSVAFVALINKESEAINRRKAAAGEALDE